MRDVIVCTKDKFLFKDQSYDEIAIKKIIKKEVELFIIEENILVKTFENVKKVSESVVSKIVKEEYGDKINILMHYEHDRKRKKLYLYSIGNESKVKFISKSLKELNVLPIQFYIKRIVEKKVRRVNEYIIVVEINGVVYCLDIHNNFIVKSRIESRESFIINYKFDDILDGKTIVINSIDKDLIPKEFQCKFNIIVLEIGEKINEKIFKV